VEVEVEERVAVLDRAQPVGRPDLVQPLVELGERADVLPEAPRCDREVLPHGRPVDPFQHERVGSALEHAGHREPVRARVDHHELLALGIAAGFEAP
jgi:hypothetical protein